MRNLILIALILLGSMVPMSANADETKDDFSVSGLQCFTSGARKFVTIKTNRAVYALNGSAMTLFNSLDKKGVNGLPRRMGRDYLDYSLLKSLIKKGLLLCD
ncbi:MAG: hypothetical protein COB49_00515 [Alphaproteobacteria bacterium]|nr:MAG: hypothetical protein COB49_00515 [Alphaproteobacteria bacterium]